MKIVVLPSAAADTCMYSMGSLAQSYLTVFELEMLFILFNFSKLTSAVGSSQSKLGSAPLQLGKQTPCVSFLGGRLPLQMGVPAVDLPGVC